MILSSIPEPTEGIQHVQNNIFTHVEGKSLGEGTLYITESCVAWRTLEGQGFSLFYPNISLHAVSRDLTAFPQECLFLMVEGKLSDEAERQEDSSDDECRMGGDDPSTEIRFCPNDKTSLDAMFSAMSDCQALHPDPQDTDSEAEDFEANYYEGEEGAENLTEEGQRTLQHLENLLINGQGDSPSQPAVTAQNGHVPANQNQEQFEDAEDQEMH